jgi:hypothetical protein
MLTVPTCINLPESTVSGPDSIDQCIDKKHFNAYDKNISYRYNSRGFRDAEWPTTDLSEVVWCVGDSFTVGIGQPFHEIWPQTLENKIGKRCLNISEHGCSNDTIRLRICHIVKQYNPKNIVVMWSYFHRRRKNGHNTHHDQKDFGLEADIKNFLENYECVQALPVNIIHSVVPEALTIGNCDTEKQSHYLINKFAKKKLDLIWVKQLDFARDGIHFDIQTSKNFVELVAKNLKI